MEIPSLITTPKKLYRGINSTNFMIDLHIHTSESDGENTITEISDTCKNLGLLAYSIANHNTTAGQKRAVNCARLNKIGYLTGIELSTIAIIDTTPEYVHLLGYGIDPDDHSLNSELASLRYQQMDALYRIKAYLSARYSTRDAITMQDLDRINEKKGSISSFDIAKLLVQKQYAFNIKDAYDSHLSQIRVLQPFLKFQDAAELIEGAGGKRVIAHPWLNNLSHMDLSSLQDQFEGIEAYGMANHGQSLKYSNIAFKLNKFITFGSDHHGNGRDRLGKLQAPDYVTEEILDIFEFK